MTEDTKRSWNPLLWTGFALAIVGMVSYPTFFIRFASTRDFPWVNLLLIAAAVWLFVAGLRRAFRQPERYRGKVSGSIFASLSFLLIGFFLAEIFYMARQVPKSEGAPRTGEIAPDFALLDANGQMVTLSSLLNSPFTSNDWPAAGAAGGKTAGAVLIFYRGYW